MVADNRLAEIFASFVTEPGCVMILKIPPNWQMKGVSGPLFTKFNHDGREGR